MSDSIFPQTIDVVKTKCDAIGIELVLGKPENFDWSKSNEFSGMLV